MRLLHIADVHLDRPFVGMPLQAARARRAEVRATFSHCLAVAKDRGVDAVTIGGDLWEDENVIADTRLSVAREFERLEIPVLVVAGNHDPLIYGGNYEQTQWPSNVRVFGGGDPQEHRIGDASIWGASWTADGLSADFLDTVDVPDDNRAHLLMLHGTSVSNAHFAEGAHCPFIASDATSAGFVAVLCGHIHRASYRDGVVYPGSPEPLGWSETGRHCVALVETSGAEVSVELVDVNRRSYVSIDADCAGAASSAEIGERIEAAIAAAAVEATDAALSLSLTGAIGAEAELVPSEIAAELKTRFDPVRVQDNTTRAWDLGALAQQPTADGRFVATLLEELETTSDDADRAVVELALELGLRAMKGDGAVVDVG